MNRKQWYCFLLFIPDLIPCILWMLNFIHAPQGELEAASFSGVLYNQTILWLNYVSMPFVFFAAITLYRAWDKTADQMAEASWKLPVFFMPVYLVCFYYANLHTGLSFSAAPGFCVFVAFSILVVGYFYVLLAHILTWVIDSIGWLAA